jgi:uncharacterized membrane protein
MRQHGLLPLAIRRIALLISLLLANIGQRAHALSVLRRPPARHPCRGSFSRTIGNRIGVTEDSLLRFSHRDGFTEDENGSDARSLSGSSTASNAPSCWNPTLRKAMGAVAGAGVVETAYLTYIKLAGLDASATALCRAFSNEDGGMGRGTCGNVLSGPYSTMPGTGVPLATLGLLAYASVAYLALSPLLDPPRAGDSDRDLNNRVALTAITTFMGVFSVFLVSLLLGVLKEQCAYCFLSAAFSISLASMSWLGGALPEQPPGRMKIGALASLSASLAAVGVSVALYAGTPLPPSTSSSSTSSSYTVLAADGSRRSAGASQQQAALLAQASSTQVEGERPPPITTQSTSRAMSIATQLQELDARFYGAYWCSHCFDQKQALGKEAMARIPYVECSKEGRNAQVQLCREKKIPGYPTWEIKGVLYPGEQALDELEDIIESQLQSPIDR